MKTSFTLKMVNKLVYGLAFMIMCSSLAHAQVCETDLIWQNYQGVALPNDLDYASPQDEPIVIENQTITLVNYNSLTAESPFNNTIFTGSIGSVPHAYVLSINGDPNDMVTQKTIFNETVYDLEFSILDIDRNQDGHWQDWVAVKVYSGPFKYNITSSNITNLGTAVSFNDSDDSFSGTFEIDNATGVAGNVDMSFPGAVDSVVINYTYGPLSGGQLGIQVVALSNLNFKSTMTCVGPKAENVNACLDYQTNNNELDLLSNVVVGSTDLDNSSFVILTAPKHGSATLISENGSVIYSPEISYSGLDSLEYQICDDNSLCDSAWLHMIVNGDGVSIQSMDDHYPLLAKTATSGNVLVNDMNLSSGTIRVETSKTISPTNGELVLNANGSFNYTPNVNFTGHDVAKYTICHSSDASICKEALINFYVKAIVIPGAYSVVDFYDEVMLYRNANYSGSLTSNLSSIGTASSDYIYTLTSSPTNGSASVTADGRLNYSPTSEYDGSDVLTYQRMNTLNGESEIVSVNIKIISEYMDCNFSLPVANDDFGFTCENQSISGNVANNDSSNMPNQSSVSVALLEGAKKGTLVLNESGSYVYYPNSDTFGSDEFSYEICFISVDENKSSNVFVSNDVPKTLPIGVGTIYSATQSAAIGQITNVSVENLEISHGNIGELSVKLIAPSGQSAFLFKNVCNSYGSLKLNFSDNATQTSVSCPPTNNAFYKPVDSFAKFNTEDPNGTWFLQLIDNNHPKNAGILESWNIVLETSVPETLGCRQASVKVLVMPKVVAPTAVDDCVETSSSFPVDINVDHNDSDVDGDLDTKSISIMTTPNNGSATVNTNGTIKYTPDTGYSGTDYITYSICDTTKLCSTAEIKIVVSTTLAVDFAAFDVALNRSGDAVLNWSVAEGHDAESFDIERKTIDGFEYIGSVDANVDDTDYRFTDNNINHQGRVYYRIKTTEVNGESKYTDVKSVNITKLDDVKVFPNPFNDFFWVDPNTSDEALELILTDYNGSIIMIKTINNKTRIDINNIDIPTGMYLLTVNSETESTSVKMIKL